jgi:hypothetical protein
MGEATACNFGNKHLVKNVNNAVVRKNVRFDNVGIVYLNGVMQSHLEASILTSCLEPFSLFQIHNIADITFPGTT